MAGQNDAADADQRLRIDAAKYRKSQLCIDTSQGRGAAATEAAAPGRYIRCHLPSAGGSPKIEPFKRINKENKDLSDIFYRLRVSYFSP